MGWQGSPGAAAVQAPWLFPRVATGPRFPARPCFRASFCRRCGEEVLRPCCRWIWTFVRPWERCCSRGRLELPQVYLLLCWCHRATYLAHGVQTPTEHPCAVGPQEAPTAAQGRTSRVHRPQGGGGRTPRDHRRSGRDSTELRPQTWVFGPAQQMTASHRADERSPAAQEATELLRYGDNGLRESRLRLDGGAALLLQSILPLCMA